MYVYIYYIPLWLPAYHNYRDNVQDQPWKNYIPGPVQLSERLAFA